MARISTYDLDDTLERDDKIIGTDTSNASATMNFSLEQLGEFFSRTGFAESSVVFTFDVGGVYDSNNDGLPVQIEDGHIYWNSTTGAALTEIIIPLQTNTGIDTEVLVAGLSDEVIILNQVGENRGNAYGFFNVGDTRNLTPVQIGGVNRGYRVPVQIHDVGTSTENLPTDHAVLTPAGIASSITDISNRLLTNLTNVNVTAEQARDFRTAIGVIGTGGGDSNQTITTAAPITGASAGTTDDITIGIDQSSISITASQVSDFDTEVSNNADVVANTAKVTFPGFGTTSNTALQGDTLTIAESGHTVSRAAGSETLSVNNSGALTLSLNPLSSGPPGADGNDGNDGVGIMSIVRTSGDGSAGTVDTYTITFTDSTTTTFMITNGADGAAGAPGAAGGQGPQGIFTVSIFQSSATVPATPADTTDYDLSAGTFTPPTGWSTSATTPDTGQNLYESRASVDPADTDTSILDWGVPFEAGGSGPAGADGDDGVGIMSIARTAGTGAAGTVDTYTITFTDSTTTTFTVTNGADGAAGDDGNTILSGSVDPQSTDGADGDFYINTSSSTIFGPKASGAWPAGVSLIGMMGSAGNDGADGDDGTTWFVTSSQITAGSSIDISAFTAIADGDIILITSGVGAGNLFIVSNLSGTTATLTANGSIRGAMGATGGQGPQGSFILQVYRVGTTVPATPTGGMYTPSTGTLTPPADWSISPPTPMTGENLYASDARYDPATGALSAWGAPFRAGSTGPTGPPGTQGPAGTLSIGTVTTGAAGTNAVVTNTGTASMAVLDITIPRGDTGQAGSDATVTVDASIMDNSTNPVQNEAIFEALALKEDTISPTNPVNYADEVTNKPTTITTQQAADITSNNQHRVSTNNPHGVVANQIGLGNVDNTSDLNKPISTATQTALDGKVDDAQVLTNVPANALFTDTTVASGEVSGTTLTLTNSDATTVQITDLPGGGAGVFDNSGDNIPANSTTLSEGYLFFKTSDVSDRTIVEENAFPAGELVTRAQTTTGVNIDIQALIFTGGTANPDSGTYSIALETDSTSALTDPALIAGVFAVGQVLAIGTLGNIRGTITDVFAPGSANINITIDDLTTAPGNIVRGDDISIVTQRETDRFQTVANSGAWEYSPAANATAPWINLSNAVSGGTSGPTLSLNQGAAVSGQYVSGLGLASDTLTPIRANLPTVDNTITSTSTNAVQSSALFTEFATKQDTISAGRGITINDTTVAVADDVFFFEETQPSDNTRVFLEKRERVLDNDDQRIYRVAENGAVVISRDGFQRLVLDSMGSIPANADPNDLSTYSVYPEDDPNDPNGNGPGMPGTIKTLEEGLSLQPTTSQAQPDTNPRFSAYLTLGNTALLGSSNIFTAANTFNASTTFSSLAGTGTRNLGVDASGALTVSAIPGSLTTEEIQDIVGAMVTGAGSVQTGIVVTYDDQNGKLNFVVGGQAPHEAAFGGSVPTLRYTQVDPPVQHTFSGEMVSHNSGYSYVITSIDTPTGWSSIISSPTFQIVVPANVSAGTYQYTVNVTATDTTTSTTSNHAILGSIIISPFVMPTTVLNFRAGITSDETASGITAAELSRFADAGAARASSISAPPAERASDGSIPFLANAHTWFLVDPTVTISNIDNAAGFRIGLEPPVSVTIGSDIYRAYRTTTTFVSIGTENIDYIDITFA